MSMKKNQQGFTLIELIVVIVIIGLLASFMAFNFIEVNKRARDGQRKSDLQQIRSALEMYRADSNNGSYPPNSGSAPYVIVSGNPPANVTCGNAFQDSTGSTTYMQKMPCDPNNTSWNGDNYLYYLNPGDSSQYELIACLENGNDGVAFPLQWGLSEPNGCPTHKYYVLYNP